MSYAWLRRIHHQSINRPFPSTHPGSCIWQVAIIEVKKAFGGPTGLTSKAVREAAKRITKTVDQVRMKA